MLIIALVLAVIGLAALVTAVVTSNELIAWVCIGASVLGVVLLIVDALRERSRSARAAATEDTTGDIDRDGDRDSVGDVGDVDEVDEDDTAVTEQFASVRDVEDGRDEAPVDYPEDSETEVIGDADTEAGAPADTETETRAEPRAEPETDTDADTDVKTDAEERKN
jgi:hypothetical protein